MAPRLKRLEQSWRKLWIRLLVRLMRRASDSEPDWGSAPRRVLFLRHDRAGDMILSTGVMRAIAHSYPTITLDVLASPINASLVAHAGYLNDIIVFDKKDLTSYLPTALRLRRARYHAVVDCMVTAPSVTTLLLMLACGARYRIGIAGRGNDSAFNISVPDASAQDAHMVDRLAALAAAFGPLPSAADRQPVLELTPDELGRADAVWKSRDGMPRVLVNISAGTSERVWPEANYAAVMRHVLDRAPEATIRVMSAPSESERAERIANAGGGVAVRTPGIRDAVALVATADFVLTPDTSIAHAVSAFQKSAVALYVKGKRERWALYGGPGESVEHSERDLSGLPLDRVLAAIDSVWDASIVSRRG
jgi:ADP-heptose:LPS heptosyltransferase